MREAMGGLARPLLLMLAVLAAAALGYPLLSAPRFAGGLIGSALGIAGALMMALSLLYVPVIRIAAVRRRVGRVIAPAALLGAHVVLGVLGSLFGIVHLIGSLRSPIGIALSVLLSVVIASGYVGRYYMRRVLSDQRESRDQLDSLRAALARLLRGTADPASGSATSGQVRLRIDDLARSIVDLEQVSRGQAMVRAGFGRWMVVHIAASILLTAALTAHVWSELVLGMRWLS